MSLPFLSAAELGRRIDVKGASYSLEAALEPGLYPEAYPPRSAVALGAGELLVMPSPVAGHAAVSW